jgi:hypothetical protein
MALRLRQLTKIGFISAWLPFVLTIDRFSVFAPPPQQPGGFFDRCLANPAQADCLAAILVPCLCIGLLLVVVVIVVVMMARRGKKEDAVEAPPVPTTRPPTAVSMEQSAAPGGTLIVDKAPAKPDYLATLRVVDGPPAQKGMEIPIEQNLVKLGRDPAKADITFYTGQTSSVSSLHCSLRHYRERFYVTDHGSTNGTTVNGEVLEAETPFELESGDKIVLGDVASNGVSLVFTRIGDAPPPAPEGGERTVQDDRPFNPGNPNPPGGGSAGSDDDKTRFDPDQ